MPINSTLDVIIQQDDLVVLGPPSTVDISLDIGAQGDPGSQIYTGAFDPNSITNLQFNSLFGSDPSGGDLFLRSDIGQNYGVFYSYVNVPGGQQWEAVLQIIDAVEIFLNSNTDFILSASSGGTGIDNGTSTFTFGGNIEFSGPYSGTFNLQGNTDITLPTSGSVAVWQDKLSVFASTTSAELASIISDETGSGSLVFNNSPTFAGTVTLAQDPSGDLEAATKKYVDNSIDSISLPSQEGNDGKYLSTTGSATFWSEIIIPESTVSEKTSSYTLQLIDAQTIIEVNSASAQNITIPAESDADFPVGSSIEIVQTGTGQVTLIPDSGVTLLSKNSATKLSAQYSYAKVYKKSSDSWVLIGDITI